MFVNKRLSESAARNIVFNCLPCKLIIIRNILFAYLVNAAVKILVVKLGIILLQVFAKCIYGTFVPSGIVITGFVEA